MGDQNGLQEGISLYKGRKYADALTCFLALPSDASADPVEVAYYVGLCYAKLERYDDALLYLEQVVTAEDGSDDETAGKRVLQCRYLLAVIYCTTGRKKLADFELNKLLDLGYKTASVYASLAFIAWDDGDVDKCIDFYNKALAVDENNPTALNGLGYVLANEERDLAKAVGYCQRALSFAPDSAACLDSMGWVYYKMGLYSEARKYLEKAHRKDDANELIASHLQEALQAGEE
ncbi:MAG TPA: hypothetical protein DDW78_05755 [Treponema sp.]|nr:hypothetical protein [Treponema sp.]